MNKEITKEEQKDFRNKLSKAFRTLRKAGFIAKQNFWCCQSCAWADIPDEAKNVVFYHNQDNESIPFGSVHLAWSGDIHTILKSMVDAGLNPVWSGEEGKRVNVFYKIGEQNDH